METKLTAPTFKETAFNCPRCGAYAQMEWHKAYNPAQASFQESIYYSNGTATIQYHFAQCQRCKNYSIWRGAPGNKATLIWPPVLTAPLPVPDMPADVKEVYNEARSIAIASPRAAAALLRLALERLCASLVTDPDTSLNKAIGELVTKGLPERLQKAMDTLRCTGNNAIHPGQIDIDDSAETVGALFKLMNIIVERMITEEAMIDDIFDSLPDGQKQQVAKRDGKGPSVRSLNDS